MIAGELAINDPKMQDERRTIREFNSIDGRFATQYFDGVNVESGPLGKHGHRFKAETFLILKGSGFVLVVEVNSKGEMVGTPTKVPVNARMVIHFKPLEAHTFYLNPGSEMVCFGDQPFFEEDKDFVPCPDLVIENCPNLVA